MTLKLVRETPLVIDLQGDECWRLSAYKLEALEAALLDEEVRELDRL